MNNPFADAYDADTVMLLQNAFEAACAELKAVNSPLMEAAIRGQTEFGMIKRLLAAADQGVRNHMWLKGAALFGIDGTPTK